MRWLNSSILWGGILLLTACSAEKENSYTSIAGLWECEEIDETVSILIFSVDIDNVINYDDTFIISNFHDTGDNYFIRVSVVDDKLHIPRQSLLNLIVHGEGTISSDFKRIEAEYTIDDGGRTANFLATFSR